jgi:hypothetical protein
MITDILQRIGGDIPTGGVILFPMIGYKGMILGGEMIEMIIEGALASMPLHCIRVISFFKGREIIKMHGISNPI